MDATKDFTPAAAVLAGRSGRLVDLPALFGDCLVHLPMVWTIVVAVALLASALFVGTRPEGPKATSQS